MFIINWLYKYKLSDRLIAAESINSIEKNKLFKYKLSDKIVTIELINLIKKVKTTSLEFLYLFKNFKIVDKSSKVNRTIELVYLLIF